MDWQLQHARQRFRDLVPRALDEGPQTVTRRGKDAVVVIAVDEYRRLTGAQVDFRRFLLAAPDLTSLELVSLSRDLPRDIDPSRGRDSRAAAIPRLRVV